MRQPFFDGMFDPWQPRSPRRESPPWVDPYEARRLEAQRRAEAERRAEAQRRHEADLRHEAQVRHESRLRQETLLRQEELRRQELRRQEELRRQTELRRQEELRRQAASRQDAAAADDGWRVVERPRAASADPRWENVPPIHEAAPSSHADEHPVVEAEAHESRKSRPADQVDPTEPMPIAVKSDAALALRHATEELEAARARLERDRERALQDTKAQVVDKMLPILDNLDRSVEAAAQSPDAALREGVTLVRTQFEEALASLGLERIPGVGARFDPAVHEAIATIEVDDPEKVDTVVDEWRRGYRLGGRVIRSPQVRVATRRA